MVCGALGRHASNEMQFRSFGTDPREIHRLSHQSQGMFRRHEQMETGIRPVAVWQVLQEIGDDDRQMPVGGIDAPAEVIALGGLPGAEPQLESRSQRFDGIDHIAADIGLLWGESGRGGEGGGE